MKLVENFCSNDAKYKFPKSKGGIEADLICILVLNIIFYFLVFGFKYSFLFFLISLWVLNYGFEFLRFQFYQYKLVFKNAYEMGFKPLIQKSK